MNFWVFAGATILLDKGSLWLVLSSLDIWPSRKSKRAEIVVSFYNENTFWPLFLGRLVFSFCQLLKLSYKANNIRLCTCCMQLIQDVLSGRGNLFPYADTCSLQWLFTQNRFENYIVRSLRVCICWWGFSSVILISKKPLNFDMYLTCHFEASYAQQVESNQV